MSTEHFLVDFLIGLLAGAVGGISGIGGSIVMLPALGLFHGYESADKARHHVYMAASMMVNIVVALSSSLQHRRQGFVRIDLLKVMVPSMGAGMIGGVLLSSHSPGRWPVLALAVFIWCYCAFTLVTLAKKLPQRPENAPTPPASVLMGIGFATGIFGGYLGVGGGILLVPLLQIAGLNIRHAIAGSAGVMWTSATIGAGVKLWLLPESGYPRIEAIEIAVPMGMGALLGAYFGAWLSHRLKIPALKIVIVVLLSVAATRMAMSGAKADAQKPTVDASTAEPLGDSPEPADLVPQP